MEDDSTKSDLMKLCASILQSETLDKENALQIQKLYYEMESFYSKKLFHLEKTIFELRKELDIIDLNKKNENTLSLYSETVEKMNEKIQLMSERMTQYESLKSKR